MESIKAVHLSETCCLRVCVAADGFITVPCASLCKCVNLWYFQMYVCECECAYVCVCKCLSEHRGGGSPGAWQYGAGVRHTPPVKMPPMGLGQL